MLWVLPSHHLTEHTCLSSLQVVVNNSALSTIPFLGTPTRQPTAHKNLVLCLTISPTLYVISFPFLSFAQSIRLRCRLLGFTYRFNLSFPLLQGKARGNYLFSNIVPTTATRIDPKAIPPTNTHVSFMPSLPLSRMNCA